MSVDRKESVFGDRTDLTRGTLFAAITLVTLGVGIVGGGVTGFSPPGSLLPGVSTCVRSPNEGDDYLRSPVSPLLTAALAVDFGLSP